MEALVLLLGGIGVLFLFIGLFLRFLPAKEEKKEEGLPPTPPPSSPPPSYPYAPTYTSPPPPLEERPPMPSISVEKEPPVLYRAPADLYIDSSRENLYLPGKSFEVKNPSAIRYFGKGELLYNQQEFAFLHPAGKETFPLKELEHILFYPKVLVLLSPNKPTALFFLKETESLQKIIQTFQKSVL